MVRINDHQREILIFEVKEGLKNSGCYNLLKYQCYAKIKTELWKLLSYSQ